MENNIPIKSKANSLKELLKLRLTSLVVFSSVLSYVLATGISGIDWVVLSALIVGGFMIAGASNGLNQIIEKDNDALMTRTLNRPLPENRLGVKEAIVYCILFGAAGFTILWQFVNLNSALLGLLALILYAFAYTPMKKKSPWAVFVGAFPGAIPAMLGWIAATNTFGLEAGALFAIQFVWQFPHFWAIAWVLDDDYKLGGIRLLPLKEGRTKRTALRVLAYTAFLIPVCTFPWLLQMTGIVSTILAIGLSIYFVYIAFKLYQINDVKAAKKLMFASFLYLPLVQILFVLDRFQI
ncbi:MAG: protoheme IX farnesyltransferase [Ulvibacter sp.]|jgi:protoheme IX farnesyltransferase